MTHGNKLLLIDLERRNGFHVLWALFCVMINFSVHPKSSEKSDNKFYLLTRCFRSQVDGFIKREIFYCESTNESVTSENPELGGWGKRIPQKLYVRAPRLRWFLVPLPVKGIACLIFEAFTWDSIRDCLCCCLLFHQTSLLEKKEASATSLKK